MSTTPALDALRETLYSIPADQVEAPNVDPVRLAAQMRVLCLDIESRPDLLEKMEMSGFERADFDAVLQASAALSEAETAWNASGNLRKSDELEGILDEARRKRGRLIDVCRLHLGDRKYTRLLQSEVIGQSVDEIAMHLNLLATLVEENAPAFAKNRLFDLPAECAAARDIARSLTKANDQYRVSVGSKTAKELRDRAFSYAREKYAQIRASGRFVSSQEPALRKLFNDLSRDPSLPSIREDNNDDLAS